ncbi:MAG: hypothetical protein WKG00_36175 [Polyangiaceae bacterium]
MRARMAMVAGLLLLGACGKDNPLPTAPADAAVPAEAPKVFLYDAELPVPADFEAEAAASIDGATYKSELDALQQEIGGK